jgi:hypothetical protein
MDAADPSGFERKRVLHVLPLNVTGWFSQMRPYMTLEGDWVAYEEKHADVAA